MKEIYLLGATGSIGTQTLDIIRNHGDRFVLAGFSFGRNMAQALTIIDEFKPTVVAAQSEADANALQALYPDLEVASGSEGLIKIATAGENVTNSLLINALMGGVGLPPTMAAITVGRNVALANKETLVMAGHLVMKKAKEAGVHILPVDSEHSAIWQCLNGENPKTIDKLIITASGGSFREKSRQQLENVTKAEALNHPNWSMGAKITIDSATMMNKGLEVIEAHHLFDLPYEQIETILHPQSIVHSMVEFNDTSVIAHLGTPDMKIPIAYAMNYPERGQIGNTKKLDLAAVGRLDFAPMDFERFPMLAYAYEAGQKGHTYPVVLNAANEVAVDLFLQDKISFLQIETIVKEALADHTPIVDASLEEIIALDQFVRTKIRESKGA